MENKNMNFIITNDKDTKEKFLNWGLTLVSKNESVYTFVNEPNKIMNFDNLKFSFTNKMTI